MFPLTNLQEEKSSEHFPCSDMRKLLIHHLCHVSNTPVAHNCCTPGGLGILMENSELRRKGKMGHNKLINSPVERHSINKY